MITKYVLSQIRPIKKLFIIDPDDFNAFAEIFNELQTEIDSIHNLIYVNDSSLWSEDKKELVKRTDPDIILNLSNQENEILSNHFDIFCAKANTDLYKIARFGTSLYSFTRTPDLYKQFNVNINKTQKVISGTDLQNNSISLFTALNFGVFPHAHKDLLGQSIFRKVTPIYPKNFKSYLPYLFKPYDKFSHITAQLAGHGGSGHGESVWHLEYNQERLFQSETRYLLVSNYNDLSSITYFWNIRTYYPFSNFAWLPFDLIADANELVDHKTEFICFDQEIKEKISTIHPDCRIISPSQLHFKTPNQRWRIMEHEQSIPITSDCVAIHHPSQKSFSEGSSMGAFVLEIKGFEEALYPRRRNLGRLFHVDTEYPKMFEERFLRIGEAGISKYVLEFSPNVVNDFVQEIKLPTFKEVAAHLFEEAGLEIKSTIKSSILEQTVNLLGGVAELEILADSNLFEILISLTPKVRTEKVVEKILKDIPQRLETEDLMDLIAEIKSKGAVSFPTVTLTIAEIMQRIPSGIAAKKYLFPILQRLYDQKVLLRGKYFPCPHCGSNLWIQISEIARVNYCTECSNEVGIPLFASGDQTSDHFRLNQLLVRAVDQGQLSTILPISFFKRQSYRGFEYMSNLEIYKDGKLRTDVDLLVKIGRKIGVIECKSANAFHQKQVDEMLDIASKLKCDFVAFSSINASESIHTTDLFNALAKKKLTYPAFILTKNSLLAKNAPAINKFFEDRKNNGFFKGPVIL